MQLRPAISAALSLSIAALSIAIGTPAFAQRDGNEEVSTPAQPQPWQYERRRDRHANDQRRWDERGAGPEHRWHRGDRLPPEYRHRNYVVDDWRGHHLRPPPRGYEWVQSGDDYILVAIATGIIAELLLANH